MKENIELSFDYLLGLENTLYGLTLKIVCNKKETGLRSLFVSDSLSPL